MNVFSEEETDEVGLVRDNKGDRDNDGFYNPGSRL